MSKRTFKQDMITSKVREWLQSGKYVPGDQLPTSDELAMYFGVNKRTVANGLAPLVKGRLLERKPYHGTIVRKQDQPLPDSNEVALITVGQSHAYGNLAKEVNQQLMPYGLYPVMIDERLIDDATAIQSFLMRLTEKKRCAGFLIEGSTNVPYDLLKAYPKRFAHQIYIFRYHYAEDIPGAGYVLIDMEDIGRQTVTYFAEHNVRRIFFPALPEENYAGIHTSMQEQIMRSIRTYAAQHGIAFDEEIFWACHRKQISLEEAFSHQFALRDPPDALFGWDDSRIMRELMPLLETYCPDWRHKLNILGLFNTVDRKEANFPSFDFRGTDVVTVATDMLLGKRKREKVVLAAKLIQ